MLAPTQTSPQQYSDMTAKTDVGSKSILQRIAAGDADAVSDCLNTYGDLIWGLVRRYYRDASESEDVVQDIFIQLWQIAERFDPSKCSEAGFISMIARRRVIDRLRRADRDPIDGSVTNDVVDFQTTQTTSDPLEWEDEVAKAERCLAKLTPVQRKVLNLSVRQGESHSWIANHLTMPLGTVKSYARRALLQVRQCMQRPDWDQQPEAAS
ncbi:MAG: sigma-70 family RNA polymerase sigma factor [Planctomycetota bacterium]